MGKLTKFLIFSAALLFGVVAGLSLTLITGQQQHSLALISLTTPQEEGGHRPFQARFSIPSRSSELPARLVRTEGELIRRPRIAIIIDDLGFSSRQTRQVAALPGPMTLSFLPYPAGVAEQAAFAKSQGHEIFLHLPMEPGAGGEAHERLADPGPGALMTSMSNATLRVMLEKNLEKIPDITGINNHMGSRFTKDRAKLKIVMAMLAERDLIFVDSLTNGGSYGSQIAKKAGLPALTRDVFLDADFGKGGTASVKIQLAELERIAFEKGEAIAIAHPYATTLEALGPWLVTAPARGFDIVPVSALGVEQSTLAAKE
jgi:uncharacterized protein